MALSDSDPDRRNLTMTCLAICAYFLAGGSLTENTLRLPIVSIHFDRIWILVVLLWLLLFWFFMRYWQGIRPMFKAAMVEAVKKYLRIPTIREIIANVATKELGSKCKSFQNIQETQWLHRKIHINCTYELDNGKISSYSFQPNMLSKIGRDFIIWLAVNEREFGNYIAPYLLFIITCLLGAYKGMVLLWPVAENLWQLTAYKWSIVCCIP